MANPLATTSPTLAHVAFAWPPWSHAAKRPTLGQCAGARPARLFSGPPRRSNEGAARRESRGVAQSIRQHGVMEPLVISRDLLQSHPNHIEIVGEKNTIQPIIHPVAAEYTIPYTIGRGYASLPPRHELVGRYVGLIV